MKKIVCVILLLCMVLSSAVTVPLSASAATSGTCGDNLTWSFDNGTLTIQGTGNMTNYTSNSTPWYNIKDEIKQVTINNGVKSIGDSAFSHCSNLTEITIPNSITSLGSGAFYCCTSLTNITFPTSTTTIGAGAFWGCSSITSINIPQYVVSIEEPAFTNCDNLTNIYVSDDNPYFSSEDGVLFNKNKTLLICYPPNKVSTYYSIPDTVYSVSMAAFYECYNLTSVHIPSSVTTIGELAFHWCKNLTSVTIPNSVTTINEAAFNGCQSLTTITIPANVNHIGYWAFGQCANLTELLVDSENPYYASENGVLFNKDKTKLICYPAGNVDTYYIIPKTVNNIEERAFYGCKKLTTIEFFDGVTYIGIQAFAFCDRLSNIIIPLSMQTIEELAFFACKNIANVNYNGQVEDWNKIDIASGNDDLINAYLNSPTDDKITILVQSASSPIPNATVTIGDYIETTDTNGYAKFSNIQLEKDYVVNIKAAGYFEHTLLKKFYSHSVGTPITIPLLQVSEDISISSVFYGKEDKIHGDLIDLNTLTVKNEATGNYFIKPNVDWGKNSVGTMYLYGINSKKSIAFKGNTLNANIFAEFGAGEEFQLVLKTDGKTYRKDLKLKTRADIDVYLNGTPVEFDQAPIIENGRTLVPIRALAEALGSSVEWDEKNQSVILQRGIDTVVIQIDKNEIYAKEIRNLDVPAKIINNRTCIPLRAVAEMFDAEVNWDDTAKEIHIFCDIYTENDMFKSFKENGFTQFNYFADTFLDEHANGSWLSAAPWAIALSNISSWGNRIVTGRLGSYEKDLYKESLSTILSNITEIDTLKLDSGIADEVFSGVSKTTNLTFTELSQEIEKCLNNNSSIKMSNNMVTNTIFLKYFNDGMKKMTSGIDKITFTVEEWSYILTDYSKNMHYLESIKSAVKDYDEDDKDLIKAINELEQEYASKYVKVLRDLCNKALDKAGSAGITELLNLAGSSAGSMYSLATFGIESIAKLSGMANYAKNVESAVSLFGIENNLKFYNLDLLKQNYDFIHDKIKANVTEDSWSALVDSFLTTKACTLEAYKCMLAVTDNSIEKIYLKKQIEILEKIMIQEKPPKSAENMFYFAD